MVELHCDNGDGNEYANVAEPQNPFSAPICEFSVETCSVFMQWTYACEEHFMVDTKMFGRLKITRRPCSVNHFQSLHNFNQYFLFAPIIEFTTQTSTERVAIAR